jgi:CheY-like chemotaxis protein/two-component sensor histidine kinase
MEDLLDVSRITRGKLELRKEPIALESLITNAIETARPQIDAAGHRLTVSLPAESMNLHGDRVRLSQVFSNLLNNAAKYTERGGQIWVNVERQENYAAVTVKDNGIGIAPELLPGIFEMFVQVDSSMGRRQGGLGLGLTLARELVRLHGGSIEAKSAGRGQGSEFAVRLPLAQVAVSQHGRSGPQREDLQPKISRRILVVDDSAVQAKSLAMLLRVTGHDVRTAASGSEALQIIAQFVPEVALIDIGLPEMNGYELARAIRSRPESSGMVLIAQTGWGREEDRKRSREAGFDHHLTKPIDHPLLRAILAAPPPASSATV